MKHMNKMISVVVMTFSLLMILMIVQVDLTSAEEQESTEGMAVAEQGSEPTGSPDNSNGMNSDFDDDYAMEECEIIDETDDLISLDDIGYDLPEDKENAYYSAESTEDSGQTDYDGFVVNIEEVSSAEDMALTEEEKSSIAPIAPIQTISAESSISNAESILIGTGYSGSITDSNTINYYKFVLNSSGRVTLTATAEMANILYYIYDSAGNKLWDKERSWNSTTQLISTSETVDLTKGTYYFVVKQNWSSTGNYSFRLDFSDAGETFTETGFGSNNEIASASIISLNEDYNGQMAANDEKDFYKFKLDAASKINLSVTANIASITFDIYDSSGSPLWNKFKTWDDNTKKIAVSESIDLSAGVYYLAFVRNFSDTGTYTFKIATHMHSYSNVVKKATLYDNGKIVHQCSCGAISGTTIIYRPTEAFLSATVYQYDGEEKTPLVTVKGSDGKIISASNYKLRYSKDRKNVGKYTVKIKFKGNYSGSIKKTFTICPQPTSISGLTARARGFKVKWKKQSAQVTGYQIQYSTNKRFSRATTRLITKKATTSATYIGLKPKKKYYVRIRTYKTVAGIKYWSSWSSAKTVRTKK